jgi:hypothetical protein
VSELKPKGKRVNKFLKPVAEQFKQAKKHPKIAIPAVILFLVLIGGLTALVLTATKGGDDTSTTTSEAKRPDKKTDPGIAAAKKRKVKPAPVVNGSGTLDVARSVGRLAIAQARGRIKHPTGISVRVSAAPKQTVTVTYQLSCYKAVGKTSALKVASEQYRTKPPNVRSLPLPQSGSDECTVTVGAQLTKTAGDGRIKVAVIAG